MSQGDKSKDLNLLGAKPGAPTLEEQGGTEGFTNTFAKDDSSSIYRLEYNEGMSSMKAHMKEMSDMLRVLMSGSRQTASTTFTPNVPKLGEGDFISRSRDDGSSEIPSIPLTGNGLGVHAAVPPPLSFSFLPLPKPHFVHVGPSPILDKNKYSLWYFRMKAHMKGSSEELWSITEEGFHPHDRRNMTPREHRDNTLNNHTLLMIQNGLKGDQENLV